MKYIIFSGFLLLVGASSIYAERRCIDPNESYYKCKPCAPINCGDNPRPICPLICEKPGCYCRPGYLRQDGKCIPAGCCENCTGPNEIYYQCQPCLKPNCGDDINLCPAECRNPGCYCAPGYIRKGRICVPESYCGNCTGPHEQYYECKPCRPINCGDKPQEFCTAVCEKPGCYCEKGYVRKNGECIPEAACNKCKEPHEKYYECPPCAPRDCFDSPPIFCPYKCQNPGCYCEPGHLRKNGKCVPQSCCFVDQ